MNVPGESAAALPGSLIVHEEISQLLFHDGPANAAAKNVLLAQKDAPDPARLRKKSFAFRTSLWKNL